MSTCGNPQHHNNCQCGLNFQGTSRVYELEQSNAQKDKQIADYEAALKTLLSFLYCDGRLKPCDICEAQEVLDKYSVKK